VVVGASRRNRDTGAAYVFRRSEGRPSDPFDDPWIETVRLTASDAADEDHFGVPVSISGGWVAVAATHDEDAGPDTGACPALTVMATPMSICATSPDSSRLSPAHDRLRSRVTGFVRHPGRCSVLPVA